MKITWKNWVIQSDSHSYCYVLKKRIGKHRWRCEAYYMRLSDAVNAMLHERIRVETIEHIINAENEAQARVETARLIQAIREIADDIMKGLDK